MYMADKYDDKTCLCARRPVTKRSLLARDGAEVWAHAVTPEWAQRMRDEPFIHDEANPAPLTHRSCLRLSSLRNPADWQENASYGELDQVTELHCDPDYARFAWQEVQTDNLPYSGVQLTTLDVQEKGRQHEELTSPDHNLKEADLASELDVLQQLGKIDKGQTHEFLSEQVSATEWVCDVWMNGDQLIASHRQTGQKSIKARAALEALKVLRPRLAVWFMVSKKHALALPAFGPSPAFVPSPALSSSPPSRSAKGKRGGGATPSVPPTTTAASVPEWVEPLAALVEACLPPAGGPARALLLPQGARRCLLLQALARRLPVLWVLDDSERTECRLSHGSAQAHPHPCPYP